MIPYSAELRIFKRFSSSAFYYSVIPITSEPSAFDDR